MASWRPTNQEQELSSILQRAQSLVRNIRSSEGVSVTPRSASSQSSSLTAPGGVSDEGGPSVLSGSSDRGRVRSVHSSGDVIGNFQRLFAPYSSSSSHSGSSSGITQVRPGGTGRKRKQFSARPKRETWTHEFLCLASRNQTYPPNQREKLQLVDAGLGRKKITFHQSGDANHVKEKLEQMYPKLMKSGGFEILRSQGRIDPLKTVNPPKSGYSVSFLRDVSSLGSAVAYIRPIQSDLDLSFVPPVDLAQVNNIVPWFLPIFLPHLGSMGQYLYTVHTLVRQMSL